MESAETFWFVYGAGTPTFKHLSQKSAEDEAIRLAKKCPGQTFVVLQSVCSYHVADVVRIDLSPEDDLPF